ncbi:hypothetical protein PRO82_000286 [Candidatus Protochlamydia amoebophila]|nr:hypothetical protein [Candidatus Protochlamydia amoebophila]
MILFTTSALVLQLCHIQKLQYLYSTPALFQSIQRFDIEYLLLTLFEPKTILLIALRENFF